jgi:hypothetical protein
MPTGSSGFAPVDGSLVGAIRFLLWSPRPSWGGIDGVGVLIGRGNQIGRAEGLVDSRFPRNFKRSSGGWPPKIGCGVKDVFKLNW